MKLATLFIFLAIHHAAAQNPNKQQALSAMKKATEFYKDRVSTHGGYHFKYTDDLSYGRSESSETPHQVEVQREGTPRVGMAYLEAFATTGDRSFLEAARSVGEMLVAGQLCSGGWDYYTEFRPEERKLYPYRADGNCSPSKTKGKPVTTLDDNVTQACARMMMRLDRALGFSDKRIHEASLFALDSLVKAQYPNGAWPQRYNEFPDPSKFPVKKASYPDSWTRKWPGSDYQTHYTFNDNSIADAIDMMLEAARIYKEPRYLASAEKGGQFILLAQMPDPQPAWAQQYDSEMHPAWARLFEPPSVTGGESQGVMRILMVLYRETGNKKYMEPIPRALNYLKASLLTPTDHPSEIRRRVGNGPTLARLYELKTNKPLYITKGMMIRGQGMGPYRPDGYEVTYSDESVITHYAVLISGAWLENVEEEYKRLIAAGASGLRRDDALHGLSPWSERQKLRAATALEAQTVIESMDPRGAWVEEGVIGKANRVFSVYAPRNMILTIKGKPIQIKENDTIELFDGAQPPREQILVSETFARNLETLGSYYASLK